MTDPLYIYNEAKGILNQPEEVLYSRLDDLLSESQSGLAAPRRKNSRDFVSRVAADLKKNAIYVETPSAITAGMLIGDVIRVLQDYGFSPEKYQMILILVCSILIKSVFNSIQES